MFVTKDDGPPLVYNHSGTLHSSGWDIKDVRFAYVVADDTAYFGVNTGDCITGDVDCDGDPSGSKWLGRQGRDYGQLLASEYVVIHVTPALHARQNSRDVRGVLFGHCVDCGFGNHQRVYAYRPLCVDLHYCIPLKYGCGHAMPNVSVSFPTLFGAPTKRRRHYEASVKPFSSVLDAIGVQWDHRRPNLTIAFMTGSGDDGPIGEDFLVMRLYDM